MANVQPGHSARAVIDALDQAAAELNMPPAYSLRPDRPLARAGQGGDELHASRFLLSFIFMYLVLAAQFESWLHPITILLALPLTVPFALLSLLVSTSRSTSTRCSASSCCSAS